MRTKNGSKGRQRPAPFGLRWQDGRLALHPDEGPVVRRLFDLFVTHRRKKAVARMLNDAGFRTRSGASFSDTTVGRILSDPIMKGEGADEALVSVDLFDACQQNAEVRTNETPARIPVHLFAGLVTCACGGAMRVPSGNPRYVCQSCGHRIPAEELERRYFEHVQSHFLVPSSALSPADSAAKPDDEWVQVWPLLNPDEKRTIVEAMTDEIVVARDLLTINLCCLPDFSLKEIATWQQTTSRQQERETEQTEEKAAPPKPKPAQAGPLKVDVSARELWEGDRPLTPLLNETTRNFLAVLGLQVAQHVDAPLPLDDPFAEGASATVRSALTTLRGQIGAERCKRLVRVERRRDGKPGGVRLADAQVVGTGRRDVAVRDTESVQAMRRGRCATGK